MPTTTAPHTTIRPSVSMLVRLGAAIAADGLDQHEPAVADLAGRALAAGIDPVLCAVLADRSAPTVARERAFGRVSLALAAAPGGGTERLLAA